MNSLSHKTPLQQFFVVQMGSEYMAIDQQSGGYPYSTSLDRAQRYSTLEKAIQARGISNNSTGIIHCKVYGEAVMPEEIKNQLRQSAMAKLSSDELRALGLI